MRFGSFPRTLHPTQEGWGFLGLTVLLGVAALNSGNNLLYLAVALLLSLIVLSGLLSEQGFRKVRVSVHLPRRCFAGTPASVRVTVQNNKRRLPSYALQLRLAGQATGPLLDTGVPHSIKLASAFCVPNTGNNAVDANANLPGPGATIIVGTVTMLP